MYNVLIVGGGISGLTCGFELRSRGVQADQLVIVESSDSPGGNLKTVKQNGLTIEAGPNGFLDNSPATLDLVRRLDMNDRLLKSNEAAAIRFIFSRGKLRKVPKGPLGMITSGLLPLPGTLRVFMEPLIGKGGHKEETVFDFASRRIGKAAAATLVDAMVSGVFAGNSRELELTAAFPKMAAMEKDYGGLVKAMMGIRKKRKREKAAGIPQAQGGPSGPAGRLTSFKDGFAELPAKLVDELKDSIRTGVSVTGVSSVEGGFESTLSDGSTLLSKSVVLACPATASKNIVKNMDDRLEKELGAIPSSSIAVVATSFKVEDLVKAPLGFGFLVPRGMGPRILGCLWTSSIWGEDRAPKDTVLLRTMIGGAQDPEAVKLQDQELLKIVLKDLEDSMGISTAPESYQIFRYESGIAQYHPGHTVRLERINGLLAKLPGLYVSGSSYGGISVNHCIAEAPDIAARVMQALG